MNQTRLDFWKYFGARGISSLGSSFTGFALPLAIYQLTGSATNLSIAFAAGMLPYLLLGLVAGAYADRLRRKPLLIRTDILNGIVIATIPLLYHFDMLAIWWIYVVMFISATLGIFADAVEFAAIPNLVSGDDIVQANGRLQAMFSFVFLIGPPIAAAVAGVTSIMNVLFLDCLSFWISAALLATIRKSFEAAERQPPKSIRSDIAEGLAYVWNHPVLRNISIMMAMVNFVSTVTFVQLVLFAKERLNATDLQYGLLLSAGSVGTIVLSLAAGPLRKRFSFSRVALTTLALSGALTMIFGLMTNYWLAMTLWGLISGLAILFNINTGSLRQAIVPNHLLGRVISVAMVVAWSANPLGALLGGYLIDLTNPQFVYVLAGFLAMIIPIGFAFTPLGHADDYIPKGEPEVDSELQPAGI